MKTVCNRHDRDLCACTLRPALLLGLFLLTASNVAEAGSGGSVYSRFGIGDIRHYPGERYAAMGGAGIAVLSHNSVNTLTPAGWTMLNRTRYVIGGMYEGYAVRDANASTYLSSGVFNGAVLAVPLSMPNGFVLGIGLVPYSVVNYNLMTRVTDPLQSYTLQYVGEGGLSNVFIGLSAILTPDWHVGFRANYLFGSVENRILQTFGSAQYTDAVASHFTRMKGLGGTLGVIFSGLGEALGWPDSRSASVGIVFDTGVRLKATEESLYEYSVGGSITGRDTVAGLSGRIVLPISLGVGTSYTMKDEVVLACDLFYQNWNDFEALGAHPPELRDSYRMSFGLEFLPRRDVMATYFTRVAYRLGLFYSADNLRLAGKGIDEIGLTAGAGLPLFDETLLGIGVEYSLRGTTANQLVKDNILRISFTLNGGERWFMRFEEE